MKQFTRVFIRALQGAADTNDRGFITGSDLGQDLGDRVYEEISWRQRPLFRFLAGDGEFLFFRPRGDTQPIEAPTAQQDTDGEGIIWPDWETTYETQEAQVLQQKPVQPVRSRAGELKWRYKTGGEVRSSSTVSGGIVYVGSHDSHLYAISTK